MCLETQAVEAYDEYMNFISFVSIQGMCFKLRSMAPLCLCKLCFDVMLPEDDIIQVYNNILFD